MLTKTPTEGWDAFKKRKDSATAPTEDDNQPESRNLSNEERQIFDAARAAVDVIKKTYDTWLLIARGVECARNHADKISGGKRTTAFERILEQQGLSGVLGNTPASIKSTASTLLRILDHELEVGAWRRSLTSWERMKYSSPTAVLKHCPVFQRQAELDGAKAKKAEERKLTPKDRIKELEAKLAHAEEELARHDAPPPPQPMFRDPDEPGSLISITRGWASIRNWLDTAPDADKEAWRAELLDLVQNDLGVKLVSATEPAPAPEPAPALESAPAPEAPAPAKELTMPDRRRALIQRANILLGADQRKYTEKSLHYAKAIEVAERELDQIEAERASA